MSAVVSSAPAAASASASGPGSGSGASPTAATGATVSGFVGKEEPEVTTVAGRLTEKNNEDSYVGGWKDGPGTEAEFCFPNGLALGKDKQLFVSDSDNRRIRKIDLKTGAVSTFAGGGGFGYLETRAYPFADSHADLARFGEVRGICIDSKDNLYVADMFHYRIRKITPEAEVSTFAGQAKAPKPAPQPQPTPEGSVATAANGVANGTDAHGKPANGANGAAQPTATATPATPPDPNEQFADGPATSGAKFNRPSAVAVDKAHNVYVCDFSNNRIRKVSPDGNVTTHAGSGEKGYKDGPGKEAAFNWPNHIAIDRHNNLYVAEAENFRIRKVSPTGLVSTYAGSGVAGFADGPADRAKFDGPNAVAVDHDGFVYVTEDENHRVRMISPNGVVRTLAGNGDRGESNGTSAATAQFAMPTGLTVDPDTGHLYVCDYGNHLIRKVHQRAIAALKASMLKETDGRFPPMPQIDEEDDKTNDADNTDPVSTNSQSGANTTDASDAEGSANGNGNGKKKKKSSKSKKREKTENGVTEEGKATDKDDSANGSASASRKSSASANGAEGAAGKEGDKAGDPEDPAKAAAAGQEDADNKSCRMCQSKNGCEIM